MKKAKKEDKKEYKLIIIIFIVIILIDQIVKAIVLNVGTITIIPGVLQFKVQENMNSTSMSIITSLIAILIIFRFVMSQNSYIDRKIKIFLTFALVGGISNTFDKVVRGYLVEFIDFTPSISLPILNIADIFILIGWIGLAWISAVFTVKEIHAKFFIYS